MFKYIFLILLWGFNFGAIWLNCNIWTMPQAMKETETRLDNYLEARDKNNF